METFLLIFQGVTNLVVVGGIVFGIAFVRRVERERHHLYRSPVAAIKGLAEAAPINEETDENVIKQLRAISSLADDALIAAGDRP